MLILLITCYSVKSAVCRSVVTRRSQLVGYDAVALDLCSLISNMFHFTPQQGRRVQGGGVKKRGGFDRYVLSLLSSIGGHICTNNHTNNLTDVGPIASGKSSAYLC